MALKENNAVYQLQPSQICESFFDHDAQHQQEQQGFARRQWRRENAIHLGENEKREKELLNQIIKEAEEYIQAFYEKRKVNCEASKATNKKREKIYLANQAKFHKEADKHYWKAIAELIPSEVANIEKRGRKAEAEKKHQVNPIQGPKPGKPTNLARMHQMILKLQQNPLPPKEDNKDGKSMKDGEDAKIGKISTPTAAKDAAAN
ncbi:clathrin light chain 1-like [Arachis duranensis]|uniref:Clathrin light chain n=1 Tax=Arachis duranensis TaxID=130453 RepID=A0A6P4CLL4_ARADU|nr:clathrin light chain 1-like [Arachis duranensis]